MTVFTVNENKIAHIEISTRKGGTQARMNQEKLKKLLELSKSLSGEQFLSDLFHNAHTHDAFKQHPFFTDVEPGHQEPTSLFPAADVVVGKGETIVLIDLPGVAKEDVKLTVDSDHVTVQGRSKPPFPQGTSYLTERFQGEFQRSIRLPERISPEKIQIKATFEHGLLIIRIPSLSVVRKNVPIE